MTEMIVRENKRTGRRRNLVLPFAKALTNQKIRKRLAQLKALGKRVGKVPKKFSFGAREKAVENMLIISKANRGLVKGEAGRKSFLVSKTFKDQSPKSQTENTRSKANFAKAGAPDILGKTIAGKRKTSKTRETSMILSSNFIDTSKF